MIKFVCCLFCISIQAGCVPTTVRTTTGITNKLGIPASCLDSSGRYEPVKTITTRLSYNEKAHSYQPVNNQKGWIEHDFNNDGKKDYVFLERAKKTNKLRLATCIDNIHKATTFIIHEEKAADFQTIYEIIRLYQDKLQLITNRHEHNWGSDSEISLYRYDKRIKDFVLIERLIESTSGDGLRSDTEEHYNLINKRYRRSNQCGSLEEACQSQLQKGRIILSHSLNTLFKPGGKSYQLLIPD